MLSLAYPWLLKARNILSLTGVILKETLMDNSQRLSPGHKNSPRILHEALHEDFGEYWDNNADITLLQYVDDHLVLVVLEDMGYWVSAKKKKK